MTCIIGMEHKGKVYLGADRAVTIGDTVSIMNEPKIYDISNGLFNFILADAGSTKLGDIIKYNFSQELRKNTKEEVKDIHAYMRTIFVDTLALSFNEHLHQIKMGRLINENELSGLEFSEMLVGVQGHLFKVDATLSVLDLKDDIDAIGVGADVAIGSLTQSLKSNKKRDAESIKKYFRDSLSISAKYKEGVEPPYDVWILNKNDSILTANFK